MLQITNPSILIDRRTNCYSIIVESSVKDYIDLIKEIYQAKGQIPGQRDALKSSSALRIRKQMVKDIKAGAILPPIVIGLIVDTENFKRISKIENEEFSKIIASTDKGNLTIIDGMQRTTALTEAIDEGMASEQMVRIEFWISTKLNSLIYRMLVLNTGQVPWNLRRQIETVFSSMINEMRIAVPDMEVYLIDEPSRRSQGGQYKGDDLIELYLAFGGRKEKVDSKERLADEFTRLDFIEATENENFAEYFYESLKRLTLLDKQFSRYQAEGKDYRFSSGKDIFKSQPARVGFITAIAKKIYGRPGFDKPESETIKSKDDLFSGIDESIGEISNLDGDKLKEFLTLDLLSEKLSVKTSRVGDFEREFFTKAFETFIEADRSELVSMAICWQSY